MTAASNSESRKREAARLAPSPLTNTELRVAITGATAAIERAGRHIASLLATPAGILDDRIHTTAHDAQNALAAARALLDEATR